MADNKSPKVVVTVTDDTIQPIVDAPVSVSTVRVISPRPNPPSSPTYTLLSVGVALSGAAVVFTLNTTQVADGTVIPFTITGILPDEITGGILTGEFIIDASTATTTVQLLVVAVPKTMTLTLDGLGVFKDVLITDEIPAIPMMLDIDSAVEYPANIMELDIDTSIVYPMVAFELDIYSDGVG